VFLIFSCIFGSAEKPGKGVWELNSNPDLNGKLHCYAFSKLYNFCMFKFLLICRN